MRSATVACGVNGSCSGVSNRPKDQTELDACGTSSAVLMINWPNIIDSVGGKMDSKYLGFWDIQSWMFRLSRATAGQMRKKIRINRN